MPELISVNGHRVSMGPGARAVWRGLSQSHPEPVCIGTLALLLWPDHARPARWRHTIETQISRLRGRLARAGVRITSVVPHRYALAIESRSPCPPTAEREGGGDGTPSAIPAAHSSHPPRQPADLGQQHQRSGKHQHTIPERRFCPAASRQPIEGLRVRHAPKMQEQTP